MPNTWKPTTEECRLIKEAASTESTPHVALRSLVLEPGIRFNMDSERGEHINIARVTNEPRGWEDTDLWDLATWSAFKLGVELTDDGRAIVDFYIRSRRGDGDLCGNVTVYYAGGKVVRIEGYPGEYRVA